ncbi:MAG: hypothetical protein LUG92_07475 [Oscillospiraceae bacterium]|nr:hypothetical protein [Oscillospiraceae bacterium]
MKRWRGAAIIFLCIVLLICAVPTLSSDVSAASVTFIAVNDVLLELSSTPYISGGITYVPYWVFSDYFGISYSYVQSTGSAILYTGEHMIVFNISEGTTYDGSENTYSVHAIMRGGTVYLPLSFMCGFFGSLVYSYIPGVGYGDILRIKDGNVILSDAEFLDAASTLMESRYKAYVAVTPQPAATPEPTDDAQHEGQDMTLSFIGLPSEDTLQLLDSYGFTVCFFLTEEDILADPDTVRAIICSGHSVGLLVSESAEELQSAAGALFSAAQYRAVMAASLTLSLSDLTVITQEAGFAAIGFDIAAGSSLNVSLGALPTLLDGGTACNCLALLGAAEQPAAAASVLQYLDTELYNVRPPRETD